MSVRRSLTISHISDLMAINLLGEKVDCDATPLVKSWLHMTADLKVEKNHQERHYEKNN